MTEVTIEEDRLVPGRYHLKLGLMTVGGCSRDQAEFLKSLLYPLENDDPLNPARPKVLDVELVHREGEAVIRMPQMKVSATVRESGGE